MSLRGENNRSKKGLSNRRSLSPKFGGGCGNNNYLPLIEFAPHSPASLIRINTDNQNVVSWLKKGRCPKKLGYRLLSVIELMKLKYNLKISVAYIRSSANTSADLLLEECSLLIGVFKELIGFGLFIGDTDIAIVACRLFRDALAPTTKTTYKTVVDQLRR